MNEPRRIDPALLASGELHEIADAFNARGLHVHVKGSGMLQLGPAQPAEDVRILLSAGVHGDETAPVEILAQLLSDILANPACLQMELMVVIGNPAAIGSCKRYIDVDLNRLFRDDTKDDGRRESARAVEIMRATTDFLSAAKQKIHFDLHAAIRASRYPAFAVVPHVVGEALQPLSAWLGDAGFGAIVVNTRPAGTFSAFTASHCGAVSATLELGRVGRLGGNDLAPFQMAGRALAGLLASPATLAAASGRPDVFEVVQEVIKRSEAFTMAIGRTVENFTPMAAGSDIARDGDRVYCVGGETEYVLFPNPDVAIGQRAALMLARRMP